MKVSEITIENIETHLRLTEVDDSLAEELSTFLEVAINYIENYTGIKRKSEENKSQENLDTYSDFVIVVYILCQDMYDNRTMYIDGKNINNTVKTILDMHTRNNL
jgi:hypothetical protein